MAAKGRVREEEHPEEGSAGYKSFLVQEKRDSAKLELRVAEGNMEVYANMFPAAGKGAMLSVEFLDATLRSMGIVEGVDWDGIREALLRCNLDRAILRDLRVAKATPPVPERPEHIVLLPRFREDARARFDANSTIDFRALSPFITVRRGEPIGRVAPRVEGKAGVDVYGKEVPAGRTQVEGYTVGDRVKQSGSDVLADSDGQLIHDNGSLRVEEVLTIKSVDYATGDIQFPGDVYIEGQVSDDFKVMAGGSIYCKAALDAFEVQCRKDLVVGGGIIGRAPAHVRVGGNLSAKFAQNARVAVKGDAKVPGAIFACSFYVRGRLDMGEKGRIIGGEACAARGIRCFDIGTSANPRTLVHCGVDFIARQKLEKANALLQELAIQLARVEQLAARKPSARLDSMRDGIRRAMQERSEEIGALMGAVEVDDSATVEAKGTVYPGVMIEICNISHEVTQEAKKVRFRLEKVAGRIVQEPL